MPTMETELKSLRIDRSSKQPAPTSGITKYIVVTVIALVLIAGGVYAYGRLTAPIAVKTVQVQSPSAGASTGGQVVLSATGYIVAHHKIEVASNVVGRVDQINVEKGDKVKAGQVLVKLEDDDYRAQLRQQQGQLANLQARLEELQNGSRPEEIGRARADRDQAQADVADAKATLERTKQLADEGVTSKQSLDDAQAKYDGAKAKLASLDRTLDLAIAGTRREQIAQLKGQIEQAQGGLEYARKQVDDTVIRAPVNGTILDRNVEKGEFVTNGFVGDKGAKGYLVTMADLDDLQVELDINQSDFPKLGPQQKGYVTTDAYPDRKYQGYVAEVSPEADRSKATVQVKVKVLNPDGYLRPDMNSTVSFYNDAQTTPSEQTKNVVTAPTAAIQNGSVFVVVNGRARKRSVTAAGTTPAGTLVSSGLIGGEELVLNPPADLKDNQKVLAQ